MATRYERIYNDLSEHLKDISETYYTDNISSAFGHFIIKMKFGLTDEEAFDCITDGYYDNGIDAVYIENNKIVHFFQFKFPNTEKGINDGVTESEILKLENGFRIFTSNDEEFSSVKWNDLLIEKREEFLNHDIYDYVLWSVRFSNQGVNEQTNKKINNLLKKYQQQTGNIATYNYLMAEECVSLYESNIKNVWPSFKLKYKKTLSPFCDEKSEVNSAFISLKGIYDTFVDIQDEIYEGNVRYLNPNSKINDGIRNTILNAYSDFHLLNNGITIVCDKCNDNTAQSYLDITSGSIINGAQTVGTIINTLANIEKEELERYENSFVFAKIISLKKDENIINDMVYTLNTQNQMKSSYTISNDLIVKSVQEKINKETEFFLEIKSNEFNFEKENNEKFNKLNKNKIDIETFIQIYTAFYDVKNLASLSKNSKSQLFLAENIQYIINELKYEDGIFAYKIYLNLMDIIKDYRAYRKNEEKKDILDKLDINEEGISDYRFLNTGNMIIMYALGIVYSSFELNPNKEMIKVIHFLKNIFKDEANISNATKVKESFDKVRTEILKNYKNDILKA